MRRLRGTVPDRRQAHLDWLSLVDVSGPFLTLPVLLRIWPDLVAVDAAVRDSLATAHADWNSDPNGWVDWVLTDLLGWADVWSRHGVKTWSTTIPEYDTTIDPSFGLRDPTSGDMRLLGMQLPVGRHPAQRIPGDAWAATPVDRMAHLCRAKGVELGLVTDGRWWALVWAPQGGVTSCAVFDSVTWPEAADRVVVRAFRSLLERPRFFAVAENETLPALFRESVNNQEDVTDALGVQVRRAVELLVDAIGRDDLRLRDQTGRGLDAAMTAHEVYRVAVSVMMRTVFLLFAEERGLLPSDNPIYEAAYSAGRLCDDLEQQASAAGEDALEHSSAAWQRLLAVFRAVYGGVRHPRLMLPAYDGSIFDPDRAAWLETITVDDRTVLHMLASVQYVTIGRERRRLSFRALDVEQIGYVYEGLLSYEGFRADQVIVGLVGKEGLEEEVPLAALEAMRSRYPVLPDLAARIAEDYKDSRVGSTAAIERRLAPLDAGGQTEARRLLLASTTGDPALVDRILPFYGLIRRDLRGLPVVIRSGSLYVTESKLRRNTGTHYTPRFLAEQIVEGALEPLVYSLGPLQTAERSEWKLCSSTDILKLRVADIAMGSGAFLVAACRYLARRLIEAWSDEGEQRAKEYVNADWAVDAPADAEADPLVIEARREVIEHCLYGVDINPMAVEMAKLSLWLVSMDPHRPFTFLDDRLVAGDSLLGITSVEQLETMHLDPAQGRVWLDLAGVAELAGAHQLVAEVAADRIKLAGKPGIDLDDLDEKRHDLAAIEAKTARARLYADLVVGAALASAGRGGRVQREHAVAAANQARLIGAGGLAAVESARVVAERWLAVDQPDGGFDREALHWPLVFPEVFERGGFDSIVGNPPFLGGQKLTGVLGDSYREHLVTTIGRNARGSADLVAYFLLRAHQLLGPNGQTGLMATNTAAQGDTRQVGLDQLVSDGVEIRQAVKSEPWPSRSAVLQYSAIWTTRVPTASGVIAILDGQPVSGITSSLDARSRATGRQRRLAANAGIAFQGSTILGLGFTMEPEHAADLIAEDSRNTEVLFPYLNGQDLNNRPDGSASRWVIDFHDWPESKAAGYPDCYERLLRLVKPERLANNRKVYRDDWWQYAEKRPAMLRAIAGLERVVVITLHSKIVMPVMAPTGQVFSHGLGIFATDDRAMLALLSSAPHYWWAISRSSSLETRVRYTPTDVFETFARPASTDEMRVLGDRLDSFRRGLMLSRQAGLTATYNLVHDGRCHDEDIVELRRIHVAIDEAVAQAYGWTDLDLDHGFHDTRQGMRHTVGPVVRQEILDRLLELNHERYAAEQAAGVTPALAHQPALDDADVDEREEA